MTAHPVTPDLVSNLPKLDGKWCRMPVGSTHRAVLRSCGSITVFNPGSRFFDSRASSLNVHRDRRFSAYRARESNEFVSAEIAWLWFVLPREIGPGNAFVTRTNSP